MKNIVLFPLNRFDQKTRDRGCVPAGGFTLVEIIVVVMIIAITAAIALPMFSSANDVKIKSAANIVAADMEYAKSMAIGMGMNYSVVFDSSNESYKIVDSVGATISHPTNKGSDYTVNFSSDSRLGNVLIHTASFNGGSTVTFDCFGSPMNGGSVVLKAGDQTITLNIEAVTGYISIN